MVEDPKIKVIIEGDASGVRKASQEAQKSLEKVADDARGAGKALDDGMKSSKTSVSDVTSGLEGMGQAVGKLDGNAGKAVNGVKSLVNSFRPFLSGNIAAGITALGVTIASALVAQIAKAVQKMRELREEVRSVIAAASEETLGAEGRTLSDIQRLSSKSDLSDADKAEISRLARIANRTLPEGQKITIGEDGRARGVRAALYANAARQFAGDDKNTSDQKAIDELDKERNERIKRQRDALKTLWFGGAGNPQGARSLPQFAGLSYEQFEAQELASFEAQSEEMRLIAQKREALVQGMEARRRDFERKWGFAADAPDAMSQLSMREEGEIAYMAAKTAEKAAPGNFAAAPPEQAAPGVSAPDPEAAARRANAAARVGLLPKGVRRDLDAAEFYQSQLAAGVEPGLAGALTARRFQGARLIPGGWLSANAATLSDSGMFPALAASFGAEAASSPVSLAGASAAATAARAAASPAAKAASASVQPDALAAAVSELCRTLGSRIYVVK